MGAVNMKATTSAVQESYGQPGQLDFPSPTELQSKLLKGGCIGDDRGS